MIFNQTGGKIFKETFLTVHLWTAATEIRSRVSLLRLGSHQCDNSYCFKMTSNS